MGDRASRAGHGNGGRTFLFFVILTTVRIQGGEGGVAWLWILTFVRMTGVFWGCSVLLRRRGGENHRRCGWGFWAPAFAGELSPATMMAPVGDAG